jgi:hypothetical protein
MPLARAGGEWAAAAAALDEAAGRAATAGEAVGRMAAAARGVVGHAGFVATLAAAAPPGWWQLAPVRAGEEGCATQRGESSNC